MTTQIPKKTLYDRRQAYVVAKDITVRLRPVVDRIEICGSLRRGKPRVHDIEIVFIPKHNTTLDLLGQPADTVDCVEHLLDRLCVENYLQKRLSVDGKPSWGPKNKLAIHVASGIPVDFFATTELNWWNSLFVRTGGKRMNLMVTMAANKKGYSFEAYGCGFRCLTEDLIKVNRSEEDIFEFVGLKYLEPCLRP